MTDDVSVPSKLFRLRGGMVAECLLSGVFGVHGVYHGPNGMVFYLDPAAVEAEGIEVEEREKTLPEYLDSHGIAHHFTETAR